MSNFLRLLVTLAILLGAGDVSAQSSKKFDHHVAEAQRYYREKNYDMAIAEFEAAYQLDPDPVLLISIGRCHYLADRPQEALSYYNRALQGKLTRYEREEVNKSVSLATIKYQEQQKKALEEAQKKALEEAQRAAAERAALPVPREPAPPPPPEKKPLYKKGWFWGTLVGTALATGLAIGLGVGLSQKPPAGPQDVIKP